MVEKMQDRRSKLEAEFSRLNLPSGRHGDTRDRAEVIATKAGTMRTWLAGTRSVPDYPFAMLKMFELMTADAREEYRRWCRECSERGDYAPTD